MGIVITDRKRYDPFLMEPLCTESTGMDLSVMSALARAGLDPWEEAERLSGLPRWAAAHAIRLTLAPLVDAVGARALAERLPKAAPLIQPDIIKIDDQREFFRKHGLVIAVVWLAISVGFAMIDSAQSSPAPSPVAPVVSRAAPPVP